MPSFNWQTVITPLSRLEYVRSHGPIIVPVPNPRRERLRYYAAMNAIRDLDIRESFRQRVTILAPMKSGRVIIGPKEFHSYLAILGSEMPDIEKCSQEELESAWDKVLMHNLGQGFKDNQDSVSSNEEEELERIFAKAMEKQEKKESNKEQLKTIFRTGSIGKENGENGEEK